MVAQASSDVAAQGEPIPRVEIVAVPTTLFEVIDQTVSAVIDRLNWLDELDEQEGEDEAHFQEYVRWRVALVNDAVLLARALVLGEDPAQSAWQQTQALA